MMKAKKLIGLLVVLVLVLSLAACGGEGAGSSGAGTGGPAGGSAQGPDTSGGSGGTKTLRVGTTESGGSFHPWLGTPACANYLVFETIVMRTGDGTYKPWIAESWEWEDGTTLLVKLRDDVYFNNGEQLVGEDVVYTFKQMSVNPASPMAVHFANFDFDATAVSEDGLTVTFKLKSEYGPIEAYLDLPYLVDKSTCESWGDDDERWWDAPPTTGPYEIAENVSGSHLTLKLRDDYWNPDFTPDWDEIIINYYSDQTAMFVAYENGELDLVLDVSSNDLARLKDGSVSDSATAAYEVIDSNAASLLCMNPNKEEFKDAKVREAIANAIDRAAVGEVVFGGLYSTVDSVICPDSYFYIPTGTYDGGVEYAKQCMAESGYPDGFEINVVSVIWDGPIWEVVLDGLSKIGITVNLSTYDLPTCMPLWMQDDGTDAMLISVAGGNVTREPYADLSANWKNGPYPVARVMDEEYNAMFEKFVYTNDRAQREEYCQKIQQWLYDNFQCIPLVQPSYCYAYRTDVVAGCDFFSATRANLMFCYAA